MIGGFTSMVGLSIVVEVALSGDKLFSPQTIPNPHKIAKVNTTKPIKPHKIKQTGQHNVFLEACY